MSGFGISCAFKTLPVPKNADAVPEPSCAVILNSIFPSSGMVTIKSYASAIPINVLFFLTGITSNPSAETNSGSSPPKVIQKEVEAPPSIIRNLTFSPGLKSAYSMFSSPLIKNAG